MAAGHLSHLSSRMRASGYEEQFRLEVIKSAVEGFNKMVEAEKSGGRPVNRPRSWEADKRQQQKYSKKRSWYKGGGHHVPLFVPHTPGSELAKLMRKKEEENNQGRKIRFLIVELGGTKLHHILWRPNPWAGGKCGSGYTVKNNPSPSGVPSGFALGNSFRQRVIFDLISLVSS